MSQQADLRSPRISLGLADLVLMKSTLPDCFRVNTASLYRACQRSDTIGDVGCAPRGYPGADESMLCRPCHENQGSRRIRPTSIADNLGVPSSLRIG